MSKKVLYPVVILVILVGILIVNENLSKKTPSKEELLFFPDLKEQSISSILIEKKDGNIKLRKKGDVWVVSQPSSVTGENESDDAVASPLGTDETKGDSAEGAKSSTGGMREYPVDSASINAALEKVTSMKKNILVSENSEKQSVFEVDTAKGIMVTLSDNSGKKIGSFIIGKSGADYSSNYIRLMGSNSVYMVSGGVRSAMFTDLNRWRDKNIVKFEKSTAKGITLAKEDGSLITLAKADSGNPWEILEPIKNPAKTDVVNGILDKLSQFNASDFQDDVLADTAMGFDKPMLGVTVSFDNGSSRNLVFGKKNKDNKYWVKTDAKDQIYLVTEYYFNQVNKKLEDLKGEPAVKPVSTDSTKK